MATKTISITEEAYERLRTLKTGKESFTDVINRVTGKRSILEFAGILTEEEGNKLENYIKERTNASSKRREKILNLLK